MAQAIDDVKLDMCEAVNLVYKDGLKYVFVHRSFQEYFAALCAMHVVSGKAGELLKVFAWRGSDSVFRMAYDIHPELVIDEYILPEYRRLTDGGFFSVQSKRKFEFISRLCISAEMLKDADRGRGTFLRRFNVDKYEYLVDFVVEGRDVRQRPGLPFPIWKVMETLGDSFRSVMSNRGKPDIGLTLRARFQDGEMVLSASNLSTGSSKYTTKEIAAIKSAFRKSAEKGLLKSESDVKKSLIIAKKELDDIVRDHASRDKTLEELFEV